MSREENKGRWKKIVLIVVAVIAILAAAAGAAVYVLFQYMYSASQHVADEEVTIDFNYVEKAEAEGALDEGDLATLAPDEASAIESELNSVIVQIESAAAQQEVPISDYCYSILLIGSDRRNTSWYGNSDAMILLTINSKTKKIYMTSFMRDLYANIPNVGVRKLNAAHALGGGPLLADTLRSNYGVLINNYASVDFNSMSTIVDLVGGVDIDVSADEARVANNYIKEICQLQGRDPNAYYLQGGGVIHLNGIQAVAYARIRYVGNADYQRTERQREVLSGILNKSKSLSVTQLTNLANQMLPLITHNIDQGTVLSLVARIPELMGYTIVTDRVPYDGLYYGSNEMLVPDFQQTISRLHATIYATE
ncbi:MAG: LCP family protein [Lachnospiraceae bacterium]|nr:LCP family protein [Lachnospiraceae bacterium]